MIIKRKKDMKRISSEICGELEELFNSESYGVLSMVVAHDMKPTKGHYHKKIDEVYWVEKGDLTLVLYDQETKKQETTDLHEGDLAIIPKFTHHKMVKASENNTVIIVSHPRWKEDDEYVSGVLK